MSLQLIKDLQYQQMLDREQAVIKNLDKIFEKPVFENKIIEVCESCGTASCWYAEHMCEDAQNSSTRKKTVSELRKTKAEHPDNWSDKKMTAIYGEPSPFGFKD